jgi:hypothetical protein
VIHGDVVADDRRFSDYDARAMVDEDALANGRAGMNVDIRHKAREPGNEASDKLKARAP